MEFLRIAFAISAVLLVGILIIAALAPDFLLTRLRMLRNFLWPNLSARKIAAHVFAFALLLGSCLEYTPATAQNYPYQAPAYTPTAILAPVTLSATGDYYFTANGLGGATVRISGLSGTLVAAIQGSNDALSVANASANWTTIQFIPVGGGSVASSITANGFYAFNPGGLTRFRVHVTTLSGGSHVVTIGAAGTAAPNALYLLNPQAVSGPVGIVDSGGVNNLSVDSNGGALTNRSSDYPLGAVPLTASATGTTAAVTATLAGTSGKTTYICGYSIMTSATSATVVAPTITGLITGTMTRSQYVPANTAGVSKDSQDFSRCIPASAANTGIAVVSGAAGVGGVTAVNAWGYQL